MRFKKSTRDILSDIRDVLDEMGCDMSVRWGSKHIKVLWKRRDGVSGVYMLSNTVRDKSQMRMNVVSSIRKAVRDA